MNTQIEEIAPGIYTAYPRLLKNLNAILLHGFLKHYNSDGVKRTHLFNARYENIYLTENHITELVQLKSEISQIAASILQAPALKAGFWFNHMPPGAVTTLHSHDDDDELLSAVYYIKTPENSGDLIIHSKTEKMRIQPEAGMLIFFKPDTKHEVTKNMSTEARLSIGINFGKNTG